jgi:hypothetical protein
MIDYNDIDVLTELQKNPTYETCVEPSVENFVKVTLGEKILKEIDDAIQSIIENKYGEYHHQIDSHNEEKRWRTGLEGEAVVEQFLGVNFSDRTAGKSKDYNEADLKRIGLDCGVKTTEYGKFPVVHKVPKRPEIIVLKINKTDFYMCGLAMPIYTKYYTSDNLILSPSLRAKGTKTGFWGFFRLKQFNNINELKELCDD